MKLEMCIALYEKLALGKYEPDRVMTSAFAFGKRREFV